MKCDNCGNNIPKGSKECPFCNTKIKKKKNIINAILKLLDLAVILILAILIVYPQQKIKADTLYVLFFAYIIGKVLLKRFLLKRSNKYERVKGTIIEIKDKRPEKILIIHYTYNDAGHNITRYKPTEIRNTGNNMLNSEVTLYINKENEKVELVEYEKQYQKNNIAKLLIYFSLFMLLLSFLNK